MRVGTRVVARLLAVIVMLALGEGGIRIIARAAHRERGMRFDAELGWRPRPNVNKTGQVWGLARPASSNAFGWRDQSRTFQKTVGRHRIVAIGDSMTFGVGVDDGERFTDVLERECGKAEVLNLGVPGYGPDQELRLVETEAFQYDPDVLLITVTLVNDFEDVRHDVLYSWPKPYYRLNGGQLVLFRPTTSFSIALREASYIYELSLRLFKNLDVEDHVVTGMEAVDPLPVFQAVLARLSSVARDHHVQLAAVLAYSSEQIVSGLSDTEARARAAVRALGIPILDTAELLGPSVKAGDQFFAADRIHWNAAGHRRVAQALCSWSAIN